MTVPQHRLVVKEPTDRLGWPEKGEWTRSAQEPMCRAMQNASSTPLLPAPALSGEELWQQEGRMPHCLKGGMLFLISIPRALSPGRNKALAPHWTEHTASRQHRRGTGGS